MLACQIGNVEAVQLLLDNNADINLIDEYGNSALSYTCLKGIFGITLLKYFINLNIMPVDSLISNCVQALSGTKPLEYNGSVDIIEVLLPYVKDINRIYSNTYFLHLACTTGDLNLIRIILERGADRNVIDTNGRDALYIASEAGHIQLVKALLESKQIPTCNIMTSFKVAYTNNRLPIMQYLLGEGVIDPVDMRDQEVVCSALRDSDLFRQACTLGYAEFARIFIEHTTDRDSIAIYVRDSLIPAAEAGHPSVVKVLLEQSVCESIPVSHISATLLATYRRVLPSTVNGRNYEHITSWTLSLYNRYFESITQVTQLLLAHGPDVHLADTRTGETAVMIATNAATRVDPKKGNRELAQAAIEGFCSLIKLLLEHGADINQANSFTGETALLIAAAVGRYMLAELLLGHGADINQANPVTGMTALMVAAAGEHNKLVELLLGRGAEVNQVDDKSGKSALMVAAAARVRIHYFETSTVKLLLDYGADLTHRDHAGRMALDMVSNICRDPKAQALLKAYGESNRPRAEGEILLK